MPTIVADFRDRDGGGGVDLAGLFVTEDERIFVCDYGNDRILMTDAGGKFLLLRTGRHRARLPLGSLGARWLSECFGTQGDRGRM